MRQVEFITKRLIPPNAADLRCRWLAADCIFMTSQPLEALTRQHSNQTRWRIFNSLFWSNHLLSSVFLPHSFISNHIFCFIDSHRLSYWTRSNNVKYLGGKLRDNKKVRQTRLVFDELRVLESNWAQVHKFVKFVSWWLEKSWVLLVFTWVN